MERGDGCKRISIICKSSEAKKKKILTEKQGNSVNHGPQLLSDNILSLLAGRSYGV